MNKFRFNSKETFLFVIIVLCFGEAHSQPTVFSWNDRHRGYDYISNAKNQKEQGPCGIFASVAAVEAMVQIYFNTTGSELDLSESILYSVCGLDQGYLVAPAALGFFKDNGVVDNNAMEFPDVPFHNPPFAYYRPEGECDYETFQKKVKIPSYGSLSIGNNIDLKKAIMDYGPIIVVGTDADQLGDSLGKALHGGTNVNHTVLVTGWNYTDWEIKDSWPGDTWDDELVDIDFFLYDPDFYHVYPVYNDNGLKYINVKDTYGTDLYTQAVAEDEDGDGFFRWGLETYPPSGFTGCDKMDFDDGDSTIICLDGYDPLSAPYIWDTTSDYICSGGNYFTLQNFSQLSALGGFSVQWNVTPSNYFTSNATGSTTTAFVDPVDSYIGKKGKIEFQLKHDGNTIKTYKFEFVINAPREDLVSTSVLDSYGGSAQGSDDFYYLCPNTNYTIYYNNSDIGCSTSNFSWTLPYGWTENYRYLNYISINTNEYPLGYLQIYANSSCCGSSINVKNIYFGEADCGEYFIVYPNPTNSFVDVDIIKDDLPSLDYISSEQGTITIIDKSGIIKSKINFKGFPYRFNTDNLPDGLYFLNINIKDIKSTILLSVKH